MWYSVPVEIYLTGPFATTHLHIMHKHMEHTAATLIAAILTVSCVVTQIRARNAVNTARCVVTCKVRRISGAQSARYMRCWRCMQQKKPRMIKKSKKKRISETTVRMALLNAYDSCTITNAKHRHHIQQSHARIAANIRQPRSSAPSTQSQKPSQRTAPATQRPSRGQRKTLEREHGSL